jgi:DNA ligase (NAD+)
MRCPAPRFWRLFSVALLIGFPAASAIPNLLADVALSPAETPAAPRSPADASVRIAKLRREIAHADELYFQQAAPEISDAAYDRLKRELAQLEQAFPAAARAVPPLPAIGDDHSAGFARYRHRAPMLSLDKAYTEAEVRAFITRVHTRLGRDELSFIIEPKFDGLALSATYEKGELTHAATRGNGREGDEVTANALALHGLPLHLRAVAPDGTHNPIPDFIELRGEVYLRWSEFRRINREQEAAGEPPFAEPRNLAAGTLKQHDPREVAARRLDVVLYGVGAVSPETTLPATQGRFHELVHAWGLPGVAHPISAHTAGEVWSALQTVGAARSRFDFPVDGAVIKLDDVAAQRELGASESAPHWALAYKFAPDRAETLLRAITFQVGRTGVLTPVAELAPVRLGGVTIRRATLHNRDEIIRRDFRLGDTVIIEKAGEIIPALVGVDLARRPSASRPFVFPTTCPACETPLENEATHPAIRCPNRACPAQLRRRLSHFVSKSGVNIPGLGPATIEAWIANGWIKDIPDLYRLRPETAPASAHTGADHPAIAPRLFAAIDASKQAELWRFISGLGIPRVGTGTARELARRTGSLKALAALNADSLARTNASAPAIIGTATAEAIETFLRDPQNRSMLAELIALGVRPSKADEPKHQPSTQRSRRARSPTTRSPGPPETSLNSDRLAFGLFPRLPGPKPSSPLSAPFAPSPLRV